MFTTLLKQRVVLRRSIGATTDAEGDTSEGYAPGVTVDAVLQQTAAVEVTEGRTTVTSDWLLILDDGDAIGPHDRVESDGRRFEVRGLPDLVRDANGPHHVEARLVYVGAV